MVQYPNNLFESFVRLDYHQLRFSFNSPLLVNQACLILGLRFQLLLLNEDGVFNFFDVSAFLNAFTAGCP